MAFPSTAVHGEQGGALQATLTDKFLLPPPSRLPFNLLSLYSRPPRSHTATPRGDTMCDDICHISEAVYSPNTRTKVFAVRNIQTEKKRGKIIVGLSKMNGRKDLESPQRQNKLQVGLPLREGRWGVTEFSAEMCRTAVAWAKRV
ncbi:hypothetical protein M569_17695 [Genlisea aurea]|uniref:Uncharacterized protein n=1 Tax=Genlisea aurea TaxID=192259 RepID=S8DCP1_9LAMI|nr:hypothetical protein M569_17695 [Genlisea aurea]